MHVSEDEIKRLATDLVISGNTPRQAWKTAREFAELRNEFFDIEADKKIGL